MTGTHEDIGINTHDDDLAGGIPCASKHSDFAFLKYMKILTYKTLERELAWGAEQSGELVFLGDHLQESY